MSLWEGVEIYDSEHEKHKASDVLKDKVVALYFSAGWCPPCRQFTPKLKRFYEALKKAGKNFEVIFVSRDKEDEDLKEYFDDHHGKWYYLGFGNPLIQEWLAKYEVKTIPALKVVKEDGTVVVQDARTEIAQKGADKPVELFEEWIAFL
uniref:Thioredoxin domain-containing protein n=1 Tax=Panagrolaimus sp. PS1159 TaxID=55785 RepID=A0AC35G277_9BILA